MLVLRVAGQNGGWWLGAALLAGCQPGTPLHASALPASLARRTFAQSDDRDLADYLCRWHPHDWRAHLARALDADASSPQRRAELTAALRLRPHEPLLLYALAVNLLAAHAPADDSNAVALLTAALARDPENGVLDLTRAVAQARLGRVFAARTVFLATRGFPRGDLYGRRLEDALLGMLDTGLRLNPYDVIQAEDWYRALPLPPVAEWSGALETIFLDPLQQHPYDIRARGREAALGLYRLGRCLVDASLDPERIFSDGREERMLGWLLQTKAAQFLADYNRTFARPVKGFAPAEQIALRLQAAVDAPDVPPRDWELFLGDWERLGQTNPDETLGWAAQRMQTASLWRKVLRHRLHADPSAD